MCETTLQSQLADGVRKVEALNQLICDVETKLEQFISHEEAKLASLRAEVVALQHDIDHLEEEIRGERCSDG